jgi:transcriptional regulator with XRE-family HTH domain
MDDVAHCADAGALVRRTRLAAGRSQADVARFAGTSQSSLSRIELGRGVQVAIPTWAAVAKAVGLTMEIALRGDDDRTAAAMQEHCHASAGGWTIRTTIQGSEPARSETMLVRSRRQEVAVIRVWDVIGDAAVAYADLERRIAAETEVRGQGWAVSGAVVICATGHNRRRLSDAPRPTEDPFPARGSTWLGALGNDIAMPRGIGMIWTDQTAERLRPFLPYLDHRTRRRSVTRRTRGRRPAA